ncbi:MAG: right-handed parallel beta-helix repeat-containing protein [Dehalococcoidales bacterium]|nr:right-handed parallel beta-helix repeat-containing protein [Dehalococcoidales bacterium]
MIRCIKTSGRWLLSVVLMLVISVALTAALNVWAAVPQDIYVDDDYTEATGGWNVTHFATIQSAINAASPGDTINVAAGTYTEQVLIQRSVQLVGDGAGSAVIQLPAARTDTAAAGGKSWDYIIAAYPVSGTIDVVIDGFTIDADGLAKQAGTDGLVGVLFNNVNGAQSGLNNCVIQGFEQVEYESWGIRVYGDSGVTIDNNTIIDYTRDGITVSGDAGVGDDPVVTISDNTLTGSALPLNGISILDGATGTISGNTVSGLTRSTPWAAVGIMVDTSTGVQINNNTINGCFYGIYLGDATDTTVSGNTLTDNIKRGISLHNASGNTIFGNTINGPAAGTDDVGIGLANGSANNTIGGDLPADGNIITMAIAGSANLYAIHLQGDAGSGNIIKNNTITGGLRAVQFDGPPGITGTTTIANNTFSGQSFGGIIAINNGSLVITDNTLTNTTRPMEFWGPVNVTITGNTIDGALFDGINMGNVSGTKLIENNTFSNIVNGDANIAAIYGRADSDNMVINNNTISSSWKGIQIDTGCTGTVITDNTISDNSWSGISAYDALLTVTGNTIDTCWRGIEIAGALTAHNNSFLNNVYGSVIFYNNDAHDVTDNWWGSASGPSVWLNGVNQSTYNQASQVEYIQANTNGNFTYTPWLNAAPPGGESFAPVTNGDNSYASIQAAIDDATAGDTINVAAGTYDENITVDKSLTINGAGAGDTIIDGGGSGVVVLITAGNVTFQGFNVTGSGNNIQAHAGIVLQGVTGCTIENNTVSNNAANGIALAISSNNIIRNNTTNNNVAWGIVVVNPGTNDGEATAMASTGNTFEGNTSNDNGAEGIYLDKRCNNNSVIDNTLSGNSGNGIHLYESHGNTITGNIITDNVGSGIYIKSHDNNVSENTITGNNTGNSSEHAGIYLKSGWIDHKSHVDGNQLLAENNSINHNNISGNNNAGVFYLENEYTYDDDLVIDATLNWWGDASGPAHASNPDGNGDGISDNVDYEPWIGSSEELELLGDDVNYYIDSDGKILEEIVATSDDGGFTITIPEGTIALDEFGEPLPGIDVSTGNGIEPPEDAAIVGLIYNWEPEGATFDPYIIFEFHYNDEDIPSGFEETNLVIMYYDSDAAEWVALETFVDTLNNVATAYVTHFTSFSLFSVEAEIVTTTIISTIINTTTIIISDNPITVTTTQTMPQVTITQLLPGTMATVTLPVTITQTGAGATVTQTELQTTAITTTQQQSATTATSTTTTTQTITQEVINWTITIVIAIIALLIGALLVAIIVRRI